MREEKKPDRVNKEDMKCEMREKIRSLEMDESKKIQHKADIK